MSLFNERIVCTYLYTITKYGYPPPAGDTLRYVREMKELGFRSIELEGVREGHLAEMYELRHDIQKTLDELDLQLPYFCAVLPGLSSPSVPERKKQLKLFEQGCEIAHTLHARGILDNAPLPPYVFPNDIPVARHYEEATLSTASFPADLRWDEYWGHLVGTYKEVCDIAAALGLTYHLHPSIGVLCANADGFLYFSDAVKRENLRFNLDTANQFLMKENLSIALRRLSPFIDYIHLSDNRGSRVEHLRPGDGAIHWQTFFDALADTGYDGFIGLDIGGAESGITDLDHAYVSAAAWLEKNWFERS
jgi:sugar phosphate isomerase/epimerase